MGQKYSPFGKLVINSTKTTCNWARGPGLQMAKKSGRFAVRQAKATMDWAKNRVKEQGQGGHIGRAKYVGLQGRLFGKGKLFED